MRRVLLGVTLALLIVGAVFASSASARPRTIDFTLIFNASPEDACDPGVLICGRVQVPGFGFAMATFTPTGFELGPGPNCFTGQGLVGITLESDGSTLVLTTTAVACTPGGSGSSPGSIGPSQGSPFQGDGTWSVVDGTGTFAGATGGGTNTALNAGHFEVAKYEGSLTLP